MFKRKAEQATTPAIPAAGSPPPYATALQRVLVDAVRERQASLHAAISEVARLYGGGPVDAARTSLSSALSSRSFQVESRELDAIAEGIASGKLKGLEMTVAPADADKEVR